MRNAGVGANSAFGCRLLPFRASLGSNRDLNRNQETGSLRAPANTFDANTKARSATGPCTWAVKTAPRPMRLCPGCGTGLRPAKSYCMACGQLFSKERMPVVAQIGRVAAQTGAAQAKRAITRKRNAAAQRAWDSSQNPFWLNEEFYRQRIQRRLASVHFPTLLATLGVCRSYAKSICSGQRVPHPRHWLVRPSCRHGCRTWFQNWTAA